MDRGTVILDHPYRGYKPNAHGILSSFESGSGNLVVYIYIYLLNRDQWIPWYMVKHISSFSHLGWCNPLPLGCSGPYFTTCSIPSVIFWYQIWGETHGRRRWMTLGYLCKLVKLGSLCNLNKKELTQFKLKVGYLKKKIWIIVVMGYVVNKWST